MRYEIIWDNEAKHAVCVTDEGAVFICLPTDVDESVAEKVYARYEEEIQKQVAMRKAVIEGRRNINYNFKPLVWGERFEIRKSEDDTSYVDYDAKCFVLPSKLRGYHIRNFLKHFYTRAAQVELERMIKARSVEMGLHYREFRVSQKPQPFGSCDDSGRIMLSYTLAMTSKEFAESVVIHELAHLKYFDHSNDFTRLVEIHCPDYDQIDAQGCSYEVMLRAEGWVKEDKRKWIEA
ncbi:MAG: M48 family metallopeptidase [Clostridiales bacterium]|nr:M48 family metallopeptidase [Clostridiales bacterium]